MGRLKYLESVGNMANPIYAKLLHEGIYELRITFGHLEPRILYFFDGKDIILTHGFLKKTQAVPQEEIKRAETIRQSYLKNKR